MLEIKHTPLPYQASKDPQGSTWFIQSQKVNHPNASGRWADVATLSYINKCEKEDAEFIVRACNSHYELLGFAKLVIKQAKAGHPFPDYIIDCANIAIAKAENK